MDVDRIVESDVLQYLSARPDESVNTVVTSPPYYKLRNYQSGGQLGMEAYPQDYVDNLVAVFREVRRVLRKDGTLWLNLGDSYGKHKNLLGMPWRVAFALADDGWYLREDVVWHKLNPMPESVVDRPTKAHEFVFLLSKSKKYWYDGYAIRETAVNGDPTSPRGSHGTDTPNSGRRSPGGGDGAAPLLSRNARSVWSIPTGGNGLAHYATFPVDLARRCILAGCPPKVCTACGKPWVRLTARASKNRRDKGSKYLSEELQRHDPGIWHGRAGDSIAYAVGWIPGCTCQAATDGGIVLDPFMGSGTTAVAARALNRHYIGCDLNGQYVQLAQDRLKNTDPFEDREVQPGLTQLSIF